MVVIKGKEYTLDELRELRDLIEKTINGLDDADALTGTTLFPTWESLLTEGKVFTAEDVGFRCQYKDVLYKVLQPHTVQAGWEPDVAPSLYAEVLIPDENVIPEWKQPDSTNPYKKGDKVTHNGKTWECTEVDAGGNNTWEPGVYGWTEVTE